MLDNRDFAFEGGELILQSHIPREEWKQLKPTVICKVGKKKAGRL